MKYNILYVDDEISNLNAFKNLFRKKFKIITANSGQQGLEILETQPVDLIISDQRMPEMTGIEFLKKVRTKQADCKFILLTAYTDNDVIKEAVNDVGIYWYVNKPFDPDQMEQNIINATNAYHAEKKIKESEEKLRDVFNSISDVFTRSDMNGKCVLVTPSIHQMTGYTPEELLGRNLADFYVDPNQKNEIVDKLLKSRTVENFEIEVVRKDRQTITVSTNTKLYYDDKGEPLGVEGIFRDITELKKAEESLTKSEANYRNLVDNSLVGVFTTSIDGLFLFVNKAMVDMFEFDNSDQMIAEGSLARWKDPNQREQMLDLLQKQGTVTNFEAETVTRTGRNIHVIFSVKIIGDKILGMVMDITKRKNAEQKMLEHQQRLKDLANELTISEEKIRKQIAVDLHDHVGQLLASMRMQMARITDMEENPELIVRMKSISQGLLKSIQATRAAIFDLSPPQLNEIGLSAATHDWMKEQIEQKHHIKTAISSDVEDFKLDENTRVLLFRSLKELMMNTVKHARANQLTIALKTIGNTLEITIEDDGSGFNYNPDLLRLKSDSYGLFSIQERMSDLGGSMEVDAVMDKGTLIKLLVPLSENSL